ncbi:MAG: phospholipase D-like domain-containing protein [Rhabdochlamydiaceae bacterium]|nr:phospholipase D-like domain-containing protein [Candidatus Amphrikana amoebophyrae]
MLLIEAISKAQKSIDIAIFSLTDSQIIDLLNTKAKSGISISIYYDHKHSSNLEKKLSPLISLTKKRKCRLMHHKIIVIDDELSLLGSTNLTSSSIHYHSNILAAIYHPPLAIWLKENFQEGEKNAHFEIEGRFIDLYLMPDKKAIALNSLLKQIDNANQSIKGSLFSLTHPKIISAISAAKNRGCEVFFSLDKGQGNRDRNEFPIALSKGYELMHQKNCVIDDQVVMMGSSNWSKSGFKTNQEFFIILTHLSKNEVKNFTTCMLSK